MPMNLGQGENCASPEGGFRAVPEITIGLTTYQAEPFLEATLRSLLAQTERRFRLVISDDGSQDGTEDICRRWAKRDSRIEFIRQERTLGPRKNFEFLSSRCTSDYFMWASHDDLWSPDFIELCLGQLKVHPEAGFAIPSWIVESRTIPFIRRMFLPSMAFVEDPDPIQRMLTFTALPFSSFKDNLTYGVWRNHILQKIICDLKDQTRYFSIGGVANEYALLNIPGCLVPKAYLKKRYRTVPPGSFFEPLFSFVSNLNRQGLKKDLYPNYNEKDYFEDLRIVLQLAGLDETTIERASACSLQGKWQGTVRR